MVRPVASVFVGLITWFVALVAGEQVLSILLPEQFGAPQAAFQSAIENGSPFTPQALHLVLHIVLGFIASMVAGFVAVTVAGRRHKSLWLLAILLLSIGLLKAALTLQLVPVWYHLAFTGLLIPATLLGAGRWQSRQSPPPSLATPS